MAPPNLTAYDYTYSGELTKRVRRKLTRFGDGYVHRAAVGLNPVFVQYPITFVKLSKAQIASLEADLLLGSTEGVLFKSPEDSVATKWLIMDGWQVRFHNLDLGEIDVTLERLFDL